MLFGAGCAPDAEAWEDEAAQKLVAQAPTEVLGEGAKVDIVPNALEHFHHASKVSAVTLSSSWRELGNNGLIVVNLQVYGEHYPKLQELKRKYDPGDKLKGPIRPQSVAGM